MAYQGIVTATGSADSLYQGALKINSNFQELYNAIGDGSALTLTQNRSINTGAGLTGGGDLSADRTLEVDATVVRTSGTQTIGGSKTFSSGVTINSGGLTANSQTITAGIFSGSSVSVTGNINAGIFSGSSVSVTGNINAGIFSGSSANLTGIITSGGVTINSGGLTATSQTITAGIFSGSSLNLTGNITSGGVTINSGGLTATSQTITAGTFSGSSVSVTGNIDANGVNLGSVATGYYGDNTNLALRVPTGGGGLYIQSPSPGETTWALFRSTRTDFNNNIYAPGFIDSEDNNWYVNPSGNSRIVELHINGSIPGQDPAVFGSGGFGGRLFSGGYDMAAAGVPLRINRTAGNGLAVSIKKNGNNVGNIDITSDDNVNFTSFMGSHWSCLENREKPDILVGTILETIDELVEWKIIEFDYFDELLDDYRKKRIPYNGNLEINSEIEFTYDDQQYTGIIKLEQQELENVYDVYNEALNKHVKVKVSDTIGSSAVFGVFISWDNNVDMEREDEHKVEPWKDLNVGAIGNYFVRIAPDQVVNIGDLIESNGDGCGRVQSDDIIRSKTVCKVTSTIKQRVYGDGSYLVTAVLYCG